MIALVNVNPIVQIPINSEYSQPRFVVTVRVFFSLPAFHATPDGRAPGRGASAASLDPTSLAARAIVFQSVPAGRDAPPSHSNWRPSPASGEGWSRGSTAHDPPCIVYTKQSTCWGACLRSEMRRTTSSSPARARAGGSFCPALDGWGDLQNETEGDCAMASTSISDSVLRHAAPAGSRRARALALASRTHTCADLPGFRIL